MRKLLFLTVLAAAAVGVGFLAVEMLDDGSTGRRDRDAAPELEADGPDRTDGPDEAEKDGETDTEDPPARWRLTGTVREARGRPIAGALIIVGRQRVRTDDDGGYEIAADGPELRIEAVTAMGYLPHLPDRPFFFEGDGPWRRDFELTAAASLAGRVTDAAGQPVEAARVYVIPATHQLLDRPDLTNFAVTDKRGEYAFPGLPAGTTDVGVRAEGFLPVVAEDVVIPERGSLDRDFVVKPGRKIVVTTEPAPRLADGVFITAADSRLRGRLLPPGGVFALADALVGRTLAPFPVVQAAGKGTYVLTGVGPGPADILAYVRPYQGIPRFMIEEEHGILRGTTESEITMKLLRAVHVELRVRDAATGEALKPAVTRLTRGSEIEHPVGKWQVFWQLPLDDRRHTLVFTLDGYQAARLELPDLRPAFIDGKPYPNPFDVAMQRVAEGEVGTFYVVTDPPLKDARLALVGRNADLKPVWQKQLDRTDAQGRWVVSGVPVGEYIVSVLATGMIPARIPRVVVTRTAAETHRLRFEKGGGIDFEVTDADGKLLDKVHVLLKDAAGDPIDVHIMTQVSDGRGFVSINYIPSAAKARADSGLAPGNYSFTAYKEGFAPDTVTFTITGTEVAKLPLKLSPAQR